MIEAGMQRLRSKRGPQEQEHRVLNQIVTEARPPITTSQAQSSNMVQTITNENSLPLEEGELSLYITCVFPIERRAILFPNRGTFNNFRDTIRQRFGEQSNLFKYKNKANEMIALRDEEDWIVAKWEVQMEGTIRLDVYLG